MFESFLQMLGWAMLAVIGLVAVLCVLLILPRSPMRNWFQDFIKRLAATGLAGVYAISPVDIIPDIIPILGQMDDFAVLMLLLWYWYTMLSPAKPAAPARSYAQRPGGGQVIDIQPDDVS